MVQHNGKFVSYLRVSTAKQGESGLGIEGNQGLMGVVQQISPDQVFEIAAPGGASLNGRQGSLVGQVQAQLNALRQEFNLPDVSNAADQKLAADMAEWDKE